MASVYYQVCMFQANNPQDNQTIKITHNANQDVQYKYEDVPTAWCAASFKLSSVYLKSVHFIPKVASTQPFQRYSLKSI